MNSIPFEEHLAHININIEYPLKDFMDDMAGVIAKDESNVIDFPPELTTKSASPVGEPELPL